LVCPPINLPGLTQPPDPQQLAALVQAAVKASVQQGLNCAVQSAIDSLLKSLPQKGFEQIVFKSGWKMEVRQ